MAGRRAMAHHPGEADGDALMAKARFQLELLELLNNAFPDLQRVSVYASPQSLQVRTVEEMDELRRAGLTQYYLGIESGRRFNVRKNSRRMCGMPSNAPSR